MIKLTNEQMNALRLFCKGHAKTSLAFAHKMHPNTRRSLERHGMIEWTTLGWRLTQIGSDNLRIPKAEKPKSTMNDVRQAKAAFDAHRDRQEALGVEVCMVVVGYVSGREPFKLLARVAADLGVDRMPDPPLTTSEMQDVAFAAKMALAKVLVNRKKAR